MDRLGTLKVSFGSGLGSGNTHPTNGLFSISQLMDSCIFRSQLSAIT